MSKCIVYTRPDGGVTVVHPAPEYLARFNSEADGIAAVQLKAVPKDAINIIIVDHTAIPTSRRFRNAWNIQGNTVVHNMTKARNKRMSEIRTERNNRLLASDSLFARVTEIGTLAEAAALRVYRQILRDIPQTVNLNSIQDVDELAVYEPNWPVEPA